VLFGDRPGAILPLGGLELGHKGFALALLVEALTSGLAGHGRADEPTQWGASVFLQLIDPERFGGRAAFVRETARLAELCRTTPVPPGAPAVRLPGEGALARRARQLAQGVTLHPGILEKLAPWADRLGVPLPAAVPD
jgi:LDH2 family malate/lactate/ureidoglycolate dehydrogenase